MQDDVQYMYRCWFLPKAKLVLELSYPCAKFAVLQFSTRFRLRSDFGLFFLALFSFLDRFASLFWV